MERVYDLAIVGGGLAGCAATISLLQHAPQAKVLVLERGRYPRQKVCGEFLSAEGVSALGQLCLGSEALQQLVGSALALPRARIHALQRSAEFSVVPAALSLSRFELDAALWQHAISLGADCRQESGVNKVEGSGPFRLETSSGEFHARALMNAAGRWSSLGAAPSKPKDGRHWIGLKAHYRELSPSNAVELYFFPHGYCGVQPVAENVINACAMVRADIGKSLDQVFAQHAALRSRSRRWQLLTEPVATAPLLFRKPQPVARDVLNLGDAAGFIDPFSGNGMTLALQSGMLGAECINEYVAGRTTLPKALALYSTRYRKHLSGSFRRVGWVRMLLSMPRPAALATLKFLDFPGVGDLLVRKTRSSVSLQSAP